jgi:magnesium transporter
MIFKDLHPADIAEAISAMKKNERNLEFLRLSSELKVEVFSFLDINIQEEIVRSMTQEDYAEVLNNLEPDDRTELLENFPDELIKYSINLLNDTEKQIALNLIGYREDSIARLMTPLYIQTKANKTVKQVLQHIKKYGKKSRDTKLYLRS